MLKLAKTVIKNKQEEHHEEEECLIVYRPIEPKKKETDTAPSSEPIVITMERF